MGEKPRAKAQVQRWVAALYRDRGEDERIIQVVAGNDPMRVRRIKGECNIEEVAVAYAFRMSETEGYGFSFPS